MHLKSYDGPGGPLPPLEQRRGVVVTAPAAHKTVAALAAPHARGSPRAGARASPAGARNSPAGARGSPVNGAKPRRRSLQLPPAAPGSSPATARPILALPVARASTVQAEKSAIATVEEVALAKQLAQVEAVCSRI